MRLWATQRNQFSLPHLLGGGNLVWSALADEDRLLAPLDLQNFENKCLPSRSPSIQTLEAEQAAVKF